MYDVCIYTYAHMLLMEKQHIYIYAYTCIYYIMCIIIYI